MEVFLKEAAKRTKPVRKAVVCTRSTPRRTATSLPIRTDFTRDPGEFEVALTGRILPQESSIGAPAQFG